MRSSAQLGTTASGRRAPRAPAAAGGTGVSVSSAEDLRGVGGFLGVQPSKLEVGGIGGSEDSGTDAEERMLFLPARTCGKRSKRRGMNTGQAARHDAVIMTDMLSRSDACNRVSCLAFKALHMWKLSELERSEDSSPVWV